ncbi:MAG: hypothetical protein LBE76_01475 [Nitrososphaerota archaeon]|nr:hypothetical protein [Nitrososphaerota archaeon]
MKNTLNINGLKNAKPIVDNCHLSMLSNDKRLICHEIEMHAKKYDGLYTYSEVIPF